MKKNCFFFPGLLCSHGFTCCPEQKIGTADSQVLLSAAKWSKPPLETNFFDPPNPVSRSQHGKSDTPGNNGEGPMAFDKKRQQRAENSYRWRSYNNAFSGKNNKLLIITGGGLTAMAG